MYGAFGAYGRLGAADLLTSDEDLGVSMLAEDAAKLDAQFEKALKQAKKHGYDTEPAYHEMQATEARFWVAYDTQDGVTMQGALKAWQVAWASINKRIQSKRAIKWAIGGGVALIVLFIGGSMASGIAREKREGFRQ